VDIIKKVTKDAERLLKSLKAKYYIELPTGEQIWHDLEGYELRPVEEVKPQRKKRVSRAGPYGSITAYFRPMLDKCADVGDIAIVPFGNLDPTILRSAIAAHCSAHWGKGTYTSTTNREKKQVEIMRTAPNRADALHAKRAESKLHSVNGKAANEDLRNDGKSKFRPLGHGMDALANLRFDDEGGEERR
jgi:hypothetical protein